MSHINESKKDKESINTMKNQNRDQDKVIK